MSDDHDDMVNVPRAIAERAIAKTRREYRRTVTGPTAPRECWAEVEALADYIDNPDTDTKTTTHTTTAHRPKPTF